LEEINSIECAMREGHKTMCRKGAIGGCLVPPKIGTSQSHIWEAKMGPAAVKEPSPPPLGPKSLDAPFVCRRT
jgi:hypothetical protein